MTGTKDAEDKVTIIEIPEAVGVFDSFEDLQKTVYDLRMVGFSRYDISLLGAQEALEETLGKAYWRAPELEDDPRAPRAAFVSEEAIGELEGGVAGGFFFLGSYAAMAAVMSVSATVAASIAAIAVVGVPAAIIGTLLAGRIGKHHQDYYATQIEHGGILLWVRVRDKEREELAVKIMKAHSGRDVHVHGWSE